MNNDVKIAEIVAKNNEMETLRALQMKVAQTLDKTTSARDIGTLAKQLREITERITQLGGANYSDEITALLDARLSAGKAGHIRKGVETNEQS